MSCLWSGPPGFNSWIFLGKYSIVVLLSTYLYFISFLYLYLYVLGDDASKSYGSFMRTKDLHVLIHIRTKGDVGTVIHV